MADSSLYDRIMRATGQKTGPLSPDEMARRIYNPGKNRGTAKAVGSLRKGLGKLGALGAAYATGSGFSTQNNRSLRQINERGGFASSTAKDILESALPTWMARRIAAGTEAVGAGVGALVEGDDITDAMGDTYNRSLRASQATATPDRPVSREDQTYAPPPPPEPVETTPEEVTAPSVVSANTVKGKDDTGTTTYTTDIPQVPQVDPETGVTRINTRDGQGMIEFANKSDMDKVREQMRGDATDANGGSFSVLSGAANIAGGPGGEKGTDARIFKAAQEAMARGEKVDIDKLYRKSGFGAPYTRAEEIDDEIASIEKQLAAPGRGLNQSMDSALRERAERNNLRRQLTRLTNARESEIAQQNVARDDARAAEALQLQKDRFNEVKSQNAATRKVELAKLTRDAMKEGTARFEKFQDEMREAANSDDPGIQTQQVRQKYLGIAKDQYLAYGDSVDDFFNQTPEGQLANRVAKQGLISAVKDEQGWFTKLFGKTPGQADVEDISFKGWKYNAEGDMIIPFVNNKAIRSDEAPDFYAYWDNLSPQERWVYKMLIERDNPGQRASVRGSQ